jgi:hypothetical protein
MHSLCWYKKLFKAVSFMFSVVILVACHTTQALFEKCNVRILILKCVLNAVRIYVTVALKVAITATIYMSINCVLWTKQSPSDLTLFGLVPPVERCAIRLRKIYKVELD